MGHGSLGRIEMEEEVARQDRELEDAIARVEHACRRSGRVPAALAALEAALIGVKPAAAAGVPSAFLGTRV
jgi:hypothetical protein